MKTQEAQFKEIVKQTKPSVLSAISKTLRPEFYSMIDDVVQETYLRAYNSLKKINSDTNHPLIPGFIQLPETKQSG